jgi:hypothetical protein
MSPRWIKWGAGIEIACSVLWIAYWISFAWYQFSFLICSLPVVMAFGWWRVFRKEAWRTAMKARLLTIGGILLTPLIAAYQYLGLVMMWTDFGRYLKYEKHFDDELVGNLFSACYISGFVCVSAQTLTALALLLLMAFTLSLKKSVIGGRLVAGLTGVLGVAFLAMGLPAVFKLGSLFLTACFVVSGSVFVAAGVVLHTEAVNYRSGK